MHTLIEAAAPVTTATGYAIFVVSVFVLAGILKYFTNSNKV